MRRALKTFALLLPLLILAAVSFIYFFCDTIVVFPYVRLKHSPVPFEEGRFEGGELRIINGIPVMTLRGSPRDMGRQAGALCGEQIRALVDEYLRRLFVDFDRMDAARARSRRLEGQIPERYLDELRGIAETSGVPYRDLLLANTFVEYYKAFACSAICVQEDAGLEGGMLVGRNLDFPSLGIAHHYSMITIYHPDDARAFASVNWPGMTGAITSINEDGLTTAMLISFGGEFDFDRMPSSFAFRLIAEKFSTVQEAADFLKDNPIASPFNLILADAADGALVVELGPNHYFVRRPLRGVLPCTNYYGEGGEKGASRDSRYARIVEFAERRRGSFTVEDVQEILGDVYLPLINIQAMVIAPRDRQIYLSIGAGPAALGAYRKIDLAPLLEQAGGR